MKKLILVIITIICILLLLLISPPIIKAQSTELYSVDTVGIQLLDGSTFQADSGDVNVRFADHTADTYFTLNVHVEGKPSDPDSVFIGQSWMKWQDIAALQQYAGHELCVLWTQVNQFNFHWEASDGKVCFTPKPIIPDTGISTVTVLPAVVTLGGLVLVLAYVLKMKEEIHA